MQHNSQLPMKKMNWMLLPLAFVVEVILSYVLPFRAVGQTQYQVGFPLPFLSVYDAPMGVSPLLSLSLNLLSLCLNIAILYFALSFMVRLYRRAKGTY